MVRSGLPASSFEEVLSDRVRLAAVRESPAKLDVFPRKGNHAAMAEWIYFLHPPREDFAATMTDEEREVWGVHFERLQRLLAEGVTILAGPTLGTVNTGIHVFEAPDEQAARRIMEEDPAIAGGYVRGELRPFKVSLLRGRD
jgi:uncharacterized protein YciI